MIKRIALGFAVAAFAAPVAQAKVDEGSIAQAQATSSVVRAHTYQPVQASGYHAFATDFPGVNWKDPGIVAASSNYMAFVTDFPSSRVQAPSSTSPELVGRFSRPDVIRGPEAAATPNVDFEDAAMAAGLILVLVLLGSGAAMLATRHMGREQTA